MYKVFRWTPDTQVDTECINFWDALVEVRDSLNFNNYEAQRRFASERDGWRRGIDEDNEFTPLTEEEFNQEIRFLVPDLHSLDEIDAIDFLSQLGYEVYNMDDADNYDDDDLIRIKLLRIQKGINPNV